MSGYGQNIASFYGDSKMKVKNYGISKYFHTDFDPDKLLEENFQKVYTNSKGYNMTVDDVSRRWYQGTYIITMKNHITCCIDGIVYDIFNPSDRIVWEVYRIK